MCFLYRGVGAASIKKRKNIQGEQEAKTRQVPHQPQAQDQKSGDAQHDIQLYASKQKCVDRDATKEFLETADCGCAKKCI